MGCLPIYYFSLFRAPIGVIDTLESIRFNFLWGGTEDSRKIQWVARERILKSKEQGGLGVGSLRNLNIGLLVKWWWRLKKEPEALWSKGDGTSFWWDDWKGDGCLKDTFPHIFMLEKEKFCTLEDRVLDIKENWTSDQFPVGSAAEAELTELRVLVDNVKLDMVPDKWKCKLGGDGNFYVENMQELLDNKTGNNLNHNQYLKLLNKKIIPIKVDCFVWRAACGRIPTGVALNLRGVVNASPTCTSCINGMEDAEHLLVRCPFANALWNRIWTWCNIDPSLTQGQSIGDIVNCAANWGRCPKKRDVLLAICYGTIWSIWRMRNDRLFSSIACSIAKGFESIVSLGYVWIKHRGSSFGMSWEDWVLNPLM